MMAFIKDDQCGAMGGFPYLPELQHKETRIEELVRRLRQEDAKSSKGRLWAKPETRSKGSS